MNIKLLVSLFLLLSVQLSSQIDSSHWLIGPSLQQFEQLSKHTLFYTDTTGKSFIYNIEESTTSPTEFSQIKTIEYSFSKEHIFFIGHLNDQQFLLDSNLNKVVPEAFEKISFCNKTHCVAKDEEYRITLINISKKSVKQLPETVKQVHISEKVADILLVEQEKEDWVAKYQLYDYEGQLLHSFNKGDFVFLHESSDYISVTPAGMKSNGIFDIKGTYLVAPSKQHIPENSFLLPDFTTYHEENKQPLLFNKEGAVTLAPTITNLVPINERFIAATKRNGKHGILDKDGKMLLSFDYTKLSPTDPSFHYSIYNQYYATADKKGAAVYIDRQSGAIHSTSFDAIGTSCKDFLAVQKEGKWGVADKTGRLIIKCQYANSTFEEKMLLHSYSGLVLYEEIPIAFHPVGASYLISVFADKEWHFYDTTGKQIGKSATLPYKEKMCILLPYRQVFYKDRPLISIFSNYALFSFEILDFFQNSPVLKRAAKDQNFLVSKKLKYRFPAFGLINASKKWLAPPKFSQLTLIQRNLYIGGYFYDSGQNTGLQLDQVFHRPNGGIGLISIEH